MYSTAMTPSAISLRSPSGCRSRTPHNPGQRVTAEGSRRSKSIVGASGSARTWQLLGLPGHQVELVAFGVGERGLADRRHAGWQRRGRELDLVERPGAQGGQPLGLLVVVVGDQDRMDAVLGRPGPAAPASPVSRPSRARRPHSRAAPTAPPQRRLRIHQRATVQRGPQRGDRFLRQASQVRQRLLPDRPCSSR